MYLLWLWTEHKCCSIHWLHYYFKTTLHLILFYVSGFTYESYIMEFNIIKSWANYWSTWNAIIIFSPSDLCPLTNTLIKRLSKKQTRYYNTLPLIAIFIHCSRSVECVNLLNSDSKQIIASTVDSLKLKKEVFMTLFLKSNFPVSVEIPVAGFKVCGISSVFQIIKQM